MVKAVVCSNLGGIDALTLQDLPARPPGPGELRVAVHAAGLNFPDLLMAAGRYQLKHPLPFVPGLEAAGVVVEAGEGADARRVGERVMFHAWQGCFAEEAVVPDTEALPMPAGFGFVQGASFMVATATATNALLQRARIEPGEVLLVHGAAGGVGLAAVEVGKLLGATVIGTASSPDKLAIARSRGCDHVIDYTRERFAERVKEITAGAGADVILDTVGGEVFDQSVRCVAWGGRILVVGFAGGTIPSLKMNQPLLKCFSIVGVRAIEHAERKPREGAAYRAWMLARAGEGALRPHVSHVLPLAAYCEALELLRTRQAIGRVVLSMRPG
jgi:NADPH2:quinone reductase